MDSINAASLLNIVGFLVGIFLYGMLAAMVWRSGPDDDSRTVRRLLYATAFLGIVWNLGELLFTAQRELGVISGNPLLIAASYAALGFLPSVVVHSALRGIGSSSFVVVASYLLSSAAAFLHFFGAISTGNAPSRTALLIMAVGALLLAAVMAGLLRKRTHENPLLWIGALVIFAVSALHLSSPGDENSLFIELLAHQSSLPLALVILIQNYRFAFADLFLKRAIAVLLLAATAFISYAFVVVPLMGRQTRGDANEVLTTGVVVVLWMTTAFAFKWLDRLAVWLVDKVLLRRPDYVTLQSELVAEIEDEKDAEGLLSRISDRLRTAFTARATEWIEKTDGEGLSEITNVSHDRDRADIFVRPHEPPYYKIRLGGFEGGRRLLSEEAAFLDTVALIAARRIDAIRVTHERCEQEIREQEFEKLATEAQLAALRAQINPHFLFNALTTIGYLINTSPEKAMDTLLRLTRLLRRVLNTGEEFTTVREEIDLVQNYLDIEQARFEERLRVNIEVAESVAGRRIPKLILQPLVENAVKHAVSENPIGGEITISANIESNGTGRKIVIKVADTGAGKIAKVAEGNGLGLGLQNVRSRLEAIYKSKAKLVVEIDPVSGTTTTLLMPLEERISE